MIGSARFTESLYNLTICRLSHHSSATNSHEYIIEELDEEQLQEAILDDLENLEPGDFDILGEKFEKYIVEEITRLREEDLQQLQVEAEQRLKARHERIRAAAASNSRSPPAAPSSRPNRRRLISSSDEEDEIAERKRPRRISSSDEEEEGLVDSKRPRLISSSSEED
ncbi:hypothetical protein QAD02_021060 [Eretmocerus hayati]|uniref:Uncharacterized protein n=1 Tax=Eretmocerus hayati TaxID=131215 RepID=A0ACC2PPD5_9HYME|nr:hypothetical protein QAD02_021060 [Eretmocerus hayati]